VIIHSGDSDTRHRDIDHREIGDPEVEGIGTFQVSKQRDQIWTIHQVGVHGGDLKRVRDRSFTSPEDEASWTLEVTNPES
jgi:hypothetical protein